MAPRLRQVPRAEAEAPIVAKMYDFMFDDRDPVAEPGTATGSPGDWWTVFALVPDVLEHSVQGFALYQSPHRRLAPRLREIAQTRVGWAAGSQFVFSQHCKSCRALGMSEARIGAIPAWQVSELFSPVERAVLAAADGLALEGGRISDDVFAVLKDHLSDEAILELVYITSLYIQHAIMSRALRVEFDDTAERIVEVPGPHASLAGRDVGADISLAGDG
jgi:alkylhydroperoxidase family enzyme